MRLSDAERTIKERLIATYESVATEVVQNWLEFLWDWKSVGNGDFVLLNMGPVAGRAYFKYQIKLDEALCELCYSCSEQFVIFCLNSVDYYLRFENGHIFTPPDVQRGLQDGRMCPKTFYCEGVHVRLVTDGSLSSYSSGRQHREVSR